MTGAETSVPWKPSHTLDIRRLGQYHITGIEQSALFSSIALQ